MALGFVPLYIVRAAGIGVLAVTTHSHGRSMGDRR